MFTLLLYCAVFVSVEHSVYVQITSTRSDIISPKRPNGFLSQ